MIRRILIYSALAAGALIFAWPFLLMATTAAKLDRELFEERAPILPEQPTPRARSPYVDERQFQKLSGPRMSEALPLIERQLRAMPIAWPTDLDRQTLVTQTARGVYSRLLSIVPRERWESSGDLAEVLAPAITPDLAAEVAASLRRSFCVGTLRAMSYDLTEDRFDGGWQLSGDARAELRAAAASYAELHYDFVRGDSVVLTQTLTTTFPVARLHRLQWSLRYDDSWHALRLFVEKNGRRYRAERALSAADAEWIVDTWQERGPDDRPDKIRTWTLLREIDRGAQYVSGANQIKVSLELKRTTLADAWFAKLLRNYRATLDYIPFWRYFATSLFLVVLNMAGTLFSCSLVAYSFARLQWPGRNVSFALLLATMMIPAQVTMIPQFLIMQKLGWYNTLQPLWIASFVAPAFYVFLLRQFLKGIPRDLEDAARLDGCGFLRIYWHIMLPLVRPTLAAIAIFTFMATWNEFMSPLIYLADQRLYPLSFGLYAFQVQVTNPGTAAGMGMMMAASLLMTLPVIAIFFFAQRYFLQGVTLTGMKG